MAAAPIRPVSPRTREDDVDVQSAIRAFVGTSSFEMAAGDLKGLDAARPWLPVGSTISVTWLPSDTHDMRVATARALADAGYVAVPHIAARRITDSCELDRLLARLSGEAGVRRAFLIAGDLPTPVGSFASSLQLLQTGLFERRGFQGIGVAGYPEGHPRIDDSLLQGELTAKIAAIWRAGMDSEVVTQFCFEAGPIARWLALFRARYPELPVRIGLAGPASIRTLMRYAKICGLGPSARAVASRGGSIARLLTDTGPDAVIRDLMAAPLVRHPATKLHLFPFGGLDRTARWVASVARGDFTLSSSESGFHVR